MQAFILSHLWPVLAGSGVVGIAAGYGLNWLIQAAPGAVDAAMGVAESNPAALAFLKSHAAQLKDLSDAANAELDKRLAALSASPAPAPKPSPAIQPPAAP